MKLNFQEYEVPMDVAGKRKKVIDARETFANVIYNNVTGIRAHALAMKIYKSEGWTDYTADEMDVISSSANRYGYPPFIDALRTQITNNDKEGE